MKILANDGLSMTGINLLQEKGFEVITTRVAQEQLANFINDQQIEALLVRSATKVRKETIDACPNLKLIGRGGVGMDNIDVDYAKSKGIQVINTPAASTISVAELVFAHLMGMVRFLHDSNRQMPLEGDSRFKELKKYYSGGTELRGKTLGIIGMGRIGKEVARIALGLGMKVLMHNHRPKTITVEVPFFDGQQLDFEFSSLPLSDILIQSDFITLHVPDQPQYLIGKAELNSMKKGVGIINTSRGTAIDEVALVQAIEAKKVAFAGLDVFESEPKPEIQILMNPEVSLSPHIGGSTIEAQNKIAIELAQQIIDLFSAKVS